MKTRRTIAMVLGIMVLMTVFAAGCQTLSIPRSPEEGAVGSPDYEEVVGTSSPENPSPDNPSPDNP